MRTKNLLTRAEAARYCTERGAPIAKNTLTKLACIGGGPIYRRWGNRSLYDTGDLDAWISKRMGPPMRSSSVSASDHNHSNFE